MKKLILLLILSIYSTLAFSEEQIYESFPVHEFAKSPLRDLKIPQNWQLFNDASELDRFHDEYKAPVNEDELIFAWKMMDLINDCERIISEFDLDALDTLPKNIKEGPESFHGQNFDGLGGIFLRCSTICLLYTSPSPRDA